MMLSMMKRVFYILVAVSFLMPSVWTTMYSQDYVVPDITISKEKVKVDGKLFYSHIVLEKQTLYSICKAYNVGIDEVYAANPSLKETGLKKNAILLIPVIDAQEDRNADKAEKQAAEKTDKKEAQEAKRNRRQEKSEFFTHTVKWYENLNDISKKYGISVEAIMKINNLDSKKLSNRQKLKIPSDPQAYMARIEAEKAESDAASGQESQEETNKEPLSENPIEYTPKNDINAVLMLPFNTEAEKQNESSMDFYSGALLAVKDLGEGGLNIDLSVYDTGGGVLPITSDRLRMSDVVIGPIASPELSALLDIAPDSTYVISPLEHRADSIAASHANFIQAPSSAAMQYEDLARWVKEDSAPSDSVIVIYEKGIKDRTELSMLRQGLVSGQVRHSLFSYSILEGRSILDALSAKMTMTGQNRILVASESEAFVNDVIRNLNLLIHNRYSITLYGASKIRSFETIDVENLHNTNFHVSMSYYIDYDDQKVRDFLMKYRALYNTEPTQFAFQGYDTMYYFCSIGAKYGNRWPSMLNGEKTEMLQSDYRFVRKGNDASKGFINTGIRRIVYGPGYSILKK